MTGKEIADKLERIEKELYDIDQEILVSFQESRESVLMFLRATIRTNAAQVGNAKFYAEALLKVR